MTARVWALIVGVVVAEITYVVVLLVLAGDIR